MQNQDLKLHKLISPRQNQLMNTQDWLLPMIFEIKTDTAMKNPSGTVKSGLKIEILN